jgi:hypothetical protein
MYPWVTIPTQNWPKIPNACLFLCRIFFIFIRKREKIEREVDGKPDKKGEIQNEKRHKQKK